MLHDIDELNQAASRYRRSTMLLIFVTLSVLAIGFALGILCCEELASFYRLPFGPTAAEVLRGLTPSLPASFACLAACGFNTEG
jgi:hypothetical protein